MAASIVGAWRVTVTIPGVPGEQVNLATITSDGTLVVAFPPVSPPAGSGRAADAFSTALGSWVSAADGTVMMTFLSLGADVKGAAAGTHTIAAQVTLSDDGASWAGPFRIDIDSAAGDRVASVAGSVRATRIIATPMAPASA